MRSLAKELMQQSPHIELTAPEVLVFPQWKSLTNSFVYTFYRGCVASFLLMAVIISMFSFLEKFSIEYYFIYIQHWVTWMCMVTSVFGTFLVLIWNYKQNFSIKEFERSRVPAMFKYYWMAHNTTLVMVMVICSTSYWLHKNVNKSGNYLTQIIIFSIFLMDILIVPYPTEFLDVLWPLTIGIVYFCFSILFYALELKNMFGDRYIYPLLDWTDSVSSLTTMITVFTFILVGHSILFIIYRVRVGMSLRKMNKPSFQSRNSNNHSAV